MKESGLVECISAAVFALLLSLSAGAQEQVGSAGSGKEFISPVDIPISLAGNFGELRPGHFHAGLDIRTQGKVGLPIKSIADGYVSRVAISHKGYGKVVYVTHNNGYTSVYAHLREFYPALEAWVKDWQYSNRSFVLDEKLPPGKFVLKQGEILGKSGNTGGSAGPHLHFEVRNTETEVAINPLFFGFPVNDTRSPILKNLAIYPLNENSSVNEKNEVLVVKLKASGGKYYLSSTTPINVYGKIGFGIETIDHVNNSPFRTGAYSIELRKNNQRVYYHIMDSIPFEESRYINVHTDYYQSSKYKRKIQRSYLIVGNKLSIYQDLVNGGELFFLDSAKHNMRYTVRDFEGNYSALEFEIRSGNSPTQVKPKSPTDQVLIYGEKNHFENEDLMIDFPATCLYENTDLRITKKAAVGRCLTPRYSVNTLFEPLHDYMNLGIRVSHIDSNLLNKLIVVSLDKNSKILAPEGGTVKGEFIEVETRSFGPYTVMADTLPPVIKLATIPQKPKGTQRIYFQLADNISGIGKIEIYVDGEWVLAEYEKNRNRAFFQLDRINPSNSSRALRVEVSDKCGNTSTLDRVLIY